MLSIIKGIQPRDQTETLLGSQMAMTQAAVAKTMERFLSASSPAEREAEERMYNRLARTFVAQVQALKHYRSGANPTVTVQNVSVADGGQAIVGNVTQAARPSGSQTGSTEPHGEGTASSQPLPERDISQ